MPQTEIAYRQGIGFEGQVITTSIRRLDGAVEEFINGLTVKLPFGRVLVRSAVNSRKVVLPTGDATAQPPVGVLVINDRYSKSIRDYLDKNDFGVPPNYPAEVMTFGDFLGWTEEAVNANDPVLYRYTAAAAPNDKLGRFAKTAATGLAAYPNARFMQSTSGAGLVIIRLGAV